MFYEYKGEYSWSVLCGKLLIFLAAALLIVVVLLGMDHISNYNDFCLKVKKEEKKKGYQFFFLLYFGLGVIILLTLSSLLSFQH